MITSELGDITDNLQCYDARANPTIKSLVFDLSTDPEDPRGIHGACALSYVQDAHVQYCLQTICGTWEKNNTCPRVNAVNYKPLAFGEFLPGI